MADSKPLKTEPVDSSKVTLKLLIDTKGQRVLFAEANKDFVDFLFSLLVLPTGTTIKLLNMEGGLSNLSKSVINLNPDYIQPNQTKDVLLKPKSVFPFCSSDHQLRLLPTEALITSPSPTTNSETAAFNSPFSNVFSSFSGNCSRRYQRMYATTDDSYGLKTYADSTGGGFVKGLVKYMVMDDLSVSPLSTGSNMTLFNKFNIKDLGDLEEKVVHIGMNEGLELLKHSLNSKTVLTDVFLGVVVVTDANMKKRKN